MAACPISRSVIGRIEELTNCLGPYTRGCVVSILDTDKKIERNMAGLGVKVLAASILSPD